MNGFEVYPWYLTKERLNLPELNCKKPELASLLGNAYREALHVMFNVNCVVKNGNPVFVAGGEYSDVWTRDGACNSFAAGSFLAPDVTRNTLLMLLANGMVNGSIAGGTFDDMQFWDKVLWIIAARRHWQITGDETFLKLAADVARKTLSYQEQHYYVPEFDLFRGPGFFLDSIGALPLPYAKIVDGKSCVADYPDACRVMTLSTNSLYVQAYRDTAALLTLTGNCSDLAAEYARKAESLAEIIRKRFFVTPNGVPAYFIHGIGLHKGKAEAYQEGAGVGFCLMFGIPSPEQAKNIFRNIHHEPRGITAIWPNLGNNYLGSGKTGSTDSGYHTPQNITIWPQVNGIWMLGCTQCAQTEMFGSELKNLCRLVADNNGIYEIYHARTGNPKLWGHPAKKDQNWGATAILSLIHHGLFGIDFTEKGIRFVPNLPQGWGEMSLRGVRCRDLELDIVIRGAGNRIQKFMLDGCMHVPELPFTLNGSRLIEIDLE